MSQTDNISVSIIDADSPVSTVRVDGIVDTVTSKEVERAIEGLINRDQHRIVLDLAGVDYISSAGWGVFISHLKEAREHSGDLRLSGMIPNVREIFELLEFDTILNSFESSSQALQSFHKDMPELAGGPRKPTQTTNGGLDELAAIGVDATSTDEELGASSTNKRFESTGSQVASARAGGSTSVRATSPESALTELIIEDPFSTIGELSLGVRSKVDTECQADISWFWVFKILWKQGLLSKKSRFRLARRKSRN